ncbi:MAG TPA: serine/threonine-protein kinase [Polyangiaceae bacterium]|nr:serine/threonine-protein kinase [Polyangiaceae bacterium]
MAHATSLPPLSAGRKLGDKFEILGVLGEGGTGIVYDARRVAEGDSVALKVIHQHLAGDPQIRGRFAREAAILRRLEGDRVCPVLEFGEISDPRRESVGLLYMVLARVDGPALDAVLKRERLLPIDRAVRILLDVCDALREAHAQGVIHRDLKPGNVLLRSDDTGARAVVVDFGMAKIMTGGGTGTTALTQHNMVFGTPEYMAPEQARGDELDARCDVYAAGIILYELLVGAVPFSGPTPLNVLTAQMTETAVPPRVRAPDRGISRALEAVVLHAIAKDPAERYPTASALAAAINAAVAAPEDVEAVRPSTRVHVRIDTTDAHGATIPSPIRLTNPSGRPPPVSSVRPPVPAASSSPWWIVICVVAAVAGIALGAWLSLHAGK